MDDERQPEVLGSLPHRRPQRRSEKRAAAQPQDAGADQAAAATEPESAGADEADPADGPGPGPPGEGEAAGTRRAASGRRTAGARRAAAAPTRARNRARAGAARDDRLPDAEDVDATPKRGRLAQPAQPEGTPDVPRHRRPVPASGMEVVGTAVQAVAELAEIGLSVGARALRTAVSRLPRP